MDRYTSIKDYHRAKLNIFNNQTAEDVAIVRAGENVGQLDSKLARFSSDRPDADYYTDGERIIHRGEGNY